MERACFHFLHRVGLALFACVFSATAVRGEELSIQAAFERDRVAMGDTVQFQVTISGMRGRPEAPEIAVDGLDVHYFAPSQSSQMRIENGRVTSSSTLTHIYQVTPRHAGTFTIPSLVIEVDGTKLRTQPVTLRVEKQNGSPGSPNAGGIDRIAFAEFVVPKRTLYLGEAVPVELRLYVDSRVRFQLEAMPLIEGEGFTKAKLTEPRQERARKDGKEYDVIVFRTAVTPSRAGQVKFGPSEVSFNAQIPQERRRDRPRSLLEEMLGDDPFNDPFFSPMRVQRVTAKAGEIPFEVKPLPVPDRPKNFSGAVGDFKLSADGNPRQLKIGDVLTMKLTISGRGNFDRVNAPAIVDSSGWQVYPAKGDFKGDDPLGISGTKTFETAVIPEMKKAEMPVYEFSYFNPATEKYVTLTAGRAPLEVTGSPAPPATRPSLPAAKPAALPPPGAETPSRPADIVGVRYDEGSILRGFEPLHEQRTFWLVQIIPLAGLLCWLGLRMRRTDEATARVVRLRREKTELWRKLRRDGSHADFLDTAARLVKLDTALVTGRSEHSVDATLARNSRPLDAATAETIEDLFNARAELLYAGRAAGGDAVPPAERARVLSALETFEKSHAKP